MVTTERRRAWAWPTFVAVTTAVLSAVPMVFAPLFYMRGDTAAQFAPTWFHLGELVRSGQWPPQLDVEAWAGGNYAAEGLFGIYNPLNAISWVFVSLMPNLALSVFLIKAATMVALALGVLFLAREYAAKPWAAASVAIALPFAGYTLYWDAGSWVSGLIAFAYLPWVWWAFRRVLHGTTNPFWAFLIGGLAVLHGNPYGTLAVVMIGLAMLIEGAVNRNVGGLMRVLGVGICVAALLPLVYLPLLETAGLADRSSSRMFFNSGKMRPALGDLFGLSSPTFVPGIAAITGPMRVPATYLAWFVVPLLPWLRFGVLRKRVREFTGLGVITLGYLLLAVGPSKLWLFRWPLRLVEYFQVGLLVLLAVLLSAGLARSHLRGRALGSIGLVGIAGWLTWSQDPGAARLAFYGTALLLVLTLVLLIAIRLRFDGWRLATVLVLGCTLVLVTQSHLFGENRSSRGWHFPTDVSAIQHRFDHLDGRVIQFAHFGAEQKGPQAQRNALWRNYLSGSMYQVADVEIVNNYTGMGFERFEKRLCLHYEGMTRPCGYQNIWKPLSPQGPPLADLMKVDTMVVSPKIAAVAAPGAGWSSASDSIDVTILKRDQPLPWPRSDLSDAGTATVSSATRVDNSGEQVELRAETATTLTFARLAWPGYTARLDGKDLIVGQDAAGLLTVRVPAESSGTLTLGWQAPGTLPGRLGLAIGLLGAALIGVLTRRQRQESSTSAVATPAS